jgi:hypothetical protein
MKLVRLASLASLACTATLLSACIVAPIGPRYGAPAGVVVVGPTYAVPGPGYAWNYHPHYGWGWHHPEYGWHRGWR